jgi:hypothetical protein
VVNAENTSKIDSLSLTYSGRAILTSESGNSISTNFVVVPIAAPLPIAFCKSRRNLRHSKDQ